MPQDRERLADIIAPPASSITTDAIVGLKGA